MSIIPTIASSDTTDRIAVTWLKGDKNERVDTNVSRGEDMRCIPASLSSREIIHVDKEAC